MPLSAPARRQQALCEIDRLIGEYKDWAGAVTLPQYTTQVESISSEVLVCADRLRKSLENLVVAGSAGAVYSHCTRIEKQIAWLWRAWFYFKEKFDQRGSDRFGDTLKAADEVIWSSYRPFFTQGLQERVPEPAPLPYIEMEFSPIALRRDQHSVIGGKQDNYELLAEAFLQLPTPILKLPVSCVANPWALALIGHETGHFVQRLIAPNSAFVKKFRQTLEEAGGNEVWGAWSQEIFADWYSVLTFGQWALWPIAQFESGEMSANVARRGQYPSPLVRLRLMAAMADGYGFEGKTALAAIGLEQPERGAFPEYDADITAVPKVAGAIAALDECKTLFRQIDPWPDNYKAEGLAGQWANHIGTASPQPAIGRPDSARLAAAGSVQAWNELVFTPANPPPDDQIEPLRERARSAMKGAGPPCVRSSSAPVTPEHLEPGDALFVFLERVAAE